MKDQIIHICTGTQGSYTHHREAICEKETQKAILLDGVWWPKSQLTFVQQTENEIMAVSPEWLEAQKQEEYLKN